MSEHKLENKMLKRYNLTGPAIYLGTGKRRY